MNKSQTRSSFSGVIDELPEVSIDNFQDVSSKAYFLSHCHCDHTSGLYSEQLLNHLHTDGVFVYMSDISAAIVRHESGTNTELMDYVKPLQIGVTTTLAIPANEVTERERHYYLDVTVLPAGHCFGSVMFLFRNMYKTVLYTGDFRVGVNDVSKYAHLHENHNVIQLDALYVDTTFLSAAHSDFPKRSESVRDVTRHIHTWLHLCTDNRVALHTSARYGYEFVYNHIHTALGESVYVGGDVWRLYSQFPKSVTGVTNDANTSRIHVCRNRTETKPHDACLPNQHNSKTNKYLYIHFSALKWTNYKDEDAMLEIKKDENKYRIDVCFATHCSRTELQYFIAYLSPKKVVGFPNKYVREVEQLDGEVMRVDAKISDENFNTEVRYVDRDLMEQMFGEYVEGEL